MKNYYKVFACCFFVLLLLASLLACTPKNEDVNQSAPMWNSKDVSDSTVGEDRPEESSFYVMFIDVGQADAALIMCDGEYMLIDGGNVDDSNRIYSVLKSKNIDMLEYVIGTHAHEDHIGGLAGALNACNAENVFCPVSEYDTKAFNSFKKAAENQGKSLVNPPVDSVYTLGSASFTVLGPRKDYEDTNCTSIVIKLQYGDTTFLFTGDAERDSEQDIIDAGCDISATVLKVGHHGSSTSSSYLFLREVMPTYAVISVGEGNDYGHPHDEVMSRLKDAGVTVLRTDELGDIVCYSDGKTVSFEGISVDDTSSNDSSTSYVANINSKVLHRSTCKSLPKEENRVYFSSIEEAEEQGYIKRCDNCNP